MVTATQDAQGKTTAAENTLTKKWGKDALAMGWTAIPTSLFFLQNKLNINPTTMNVLLNMIMHWWGSTESPFPSQTSIALRMGVSKRTVQRAVAELEKLKLIEKTTTSPKDPRFHGRNLYDLSPLAQVLNVMTPGVKADVKRRRVKTNDEGDTGDTH